MDVNKHQNNLQFNGASSPKSPFQFGLMKSLFRSSSYSTCASSCTSLDTSYTDYDHEELTASRLPAAATSTLNNNVVGAAIKSNSFLIDPSFAANFTADYVKSIHSSLGPAMQKAHELQKAMHQSHARIQGTMNRVSLLSIAVSPLASQSSQAKRLQDQIKKATQPAMTALRVFNTMHKLHGNLSVLPLQDVGSYMEALSQMQQNMNVMHQASPIVIHALGEGVTFLRGNRLVDRFHMEELNHVAETLKALIAGQEHLAMSVDIVKQALKHLKASFQRILSDYLQPVDLSHSFSGFCEKINVSQQIKQALPSPVLQLLQGISQIFSLNGQFEDVLEIYRVERGYKLQKSLQMLDLGSYLCYQTADAIDEVEWASLEEHLAMWTQHIDVFVRLVLAPEYNLYKQIFFQASVKVPHWQDGFQRMAMEVGLNSFIGFGEAFTKSHMEPQKLFKLLDMFECLENLNPTFRDLFCEGEVECKRIYMSLRNLNRGVVEGVAMVLKEIKYKVQEEQILGKVSDIMSKGGTVLQLVSYVVNYLKCMLSDWYKPLVGRALKAEQVLKDDSRPESTDAAAAGSCEEEKEKQQLQLLQSMVLEVMQALDNNLATTAQRLVGIPAYASFFLMNNYSYIYTRCLKSEVERLLGTDWIQKQLDKMELCAMQYKQEAWGQLIVLISCEGISSSFRNLLSSGSSAGRECIRQRAKAFQVALDNVVARHRAWFIPNEKLRKRISHDVLHSVVPAYRNFLDNYSHFLISMPCNPNAGGGLAQLSPSHHHQASFSRPLAHNPPPPQLDAALIKYTPERVEHMLTRIFEMRRCAPKTQQAKTAPPPDPNNVTSSKLFRLKQPTGAT